VTHNASMDGVCEYCQDDTDWDSASPPSSQVHSTMSTLNQFIDNLSTFLVQAYFPAFCYNLGMLRVAKRAWPWQSLHKRLESRNRQHISRQDLCLRLSQSHERTDGALGRAGPCLGVVDDMSHTVGMLREGSHNDTLLAVASKHTKPRLRFFTHCDWERDFALVTDIYRTMLNLACRVSVSVMTHACPPYHPRHAYGKFRELLQGAMRPHF
jgi:hypothetical protein